ncbi:nephrocystin-4-like isoform X2 [Dysidea avara]|uniref:nephrocystin-4-like isoform X2 n=1 Tax=Dysidea avara TaxID=196820 RepID=UPI0033169E3B
MSSTKYFKLTYENLEGYKNLLTRKLQDAAPTSSYYLQCCIVNVASKQFVGRMAPTAPIPLVASLQAGVVQCSIRECAYFYSEHKGELHVLIVELVASVNEEEQRSLGWSYFKVFESSKSSTYNRDIVRLPLYEGSPRVLFALSDPFNVPTAGSQSFSTIPGCILSIIVEPHPPLQKVVHLFHAYVVMTTDDVIPGVIDSSTQDDILSKPKLSKTLTASLDKLSIPLLPSVEEYEVQLLQCLYEDLSANGVELPINNLMIKERRLKIGVHNGWCYVHPPHLLYLERDFLQASRHMSSSVNRQMLVLRGSLELTELVDNPHYVIIMELEYLVNWGSAEAVGSTVVVIGWAVWQLFDKCYNQWQSSGLANVVLTLKAGPGYKPPIVPASAWNTCYRTGLRDLGKVSFRFYTDHKLVTPQHHPTITATTTPASLPASSVNLTPPPSDEEVDGDSRRDTPLHKSHVKTMEYGTQTLPVEPQPNPTLVTTGSQRPPHLTNNDTISITDRIIGTHPGGRGKISKPITAVLNSVGYPSLFEGRTLADHSDNYTAISLSKELLEPLRDSKIVFQFLALSLLPSNSGHHAADTLPTHLMISTQFYQQAPSSTHRLSLQRHSSSHPYPLSGDILVVTTGGNKSTTPGAVLQYSVNEELYGDQSGYCHLIHHLYHHYLPVDLWDGDSLCLLGSALLPLRYLLRQSHSDGVQSTLGVDILATDYDHNDSTDITVHVDQKERCVQETSHKCIGQLYVRMANISTAPFTGSLQLLPRGPHKKQRTSSVRVRKLTEEHPEVLSLLKNNRQGTTTNMEDKENLSHERKLARMEAVRKFRASQRSSELQFDNLLDDNLQTIHTFRLKVQPTEISHTLNKAITSHVHITAHVIQTTFFEHKIANPFDTVVTMVIEWNHPSLKVVTDAHEWRQLKDIHNSDTVIHRDLFTTQQHSSSPTIHMNPMEVVQVPFKYCCLEIPPVPLGSSEDIKVTFITSGGQLMSLLMVTVTHHPPSVDHFLHVFHSDHAPMNKKLFITTSSTDQQAKPVCVACSGGQVTCEMLPQVNKTSPQSVIMRTTLEPTPAILDYYLTFYRDQYYLDPISVWKVMVHSVHRVNITGTQGQTDYAKLNMKSQHNCQSIRLASSHPEALQVSPKAITHPDTFSTQDVHLLLRPRTTGVFTCMVSAIDPVDYTLLEVWLVTCTCKEPTITKKLKTNLPPSYKKPIVKSNIKTVPYFHR